MTHHGLLPGVGVFLRYGQASGYGAVLTSVHSGGKNKCKKLDKEAEDCQIDWHPITAFRIEYHAAFFGVF